MLLKALQIISIVNTWMESALKDNEVSLMEVVQLGTQICNVFGIKTRFNVKELLPMFVEADRKYLLEAPKKDDSLVDADFKEVDDK